MYLNVSTCVFVSVYIYLSIHTVCMYYIYTYIYIYRLFTRTPAMTIPSAAQTPTQQGSPWLWLSVAVRMTWADGTDKVVGMGQNYHNLKLWMMFEFRKMPSLLCFQWFSMVPQQLDHTQMPTVKFLFWILTPLFFNSSITTFLVDKWPNFQTQRWLICAFAATFGSTVPTNQLPFGTRR